MIHFSNLNKHNMSEEIVSVEDMRSNGLKLQHQAEELINTNFVKKALWKNYYILESIPMFLDAASQFKKINEVKMCIDVYEKILDQCLELDKFKSLDTISILFVYFNTCNEFGQSINIKYIYYFEKYVLHTLEKLNKNVKIGILYRLLAQNSGNTEKAIEYYRKSNQYYSKTPLNCTIDENNKAVIQINEILGKNVIWH
jgi:hypothetical protein